MTTTISAEFVRDGDPITLALLPLPAPTMIIPISADASDHEVISALIAASIPTVTTYHPTISIPTPAPRSSRAHVALEGRI